MTIKGGVASQDFSAAIPAVACEPAGGVWHKVCAVLKRELGDASFGSWIAPALLREGPSGDVVLVTPTGIARDWIRRSAWRRISELWTANDPTARRIDLKSRLEFEASAGADVDAAKVEPIEIVLPVSTDAPSVAPVPTGKPSRTQGLQERFTFETFVPGPANEFAHAVARRVASWADGHFNPVLFHGPYGFGKTHLLNALAWEAMRQAPTKRVVYLTAERFLSTFVRAVMDRQTAARRVGRGPQLADAAPGAAADPVAGDAGRRHQNDVAALGHPQAGRGDPRAIGRVAQFALQGRADLRPHAAGRLAGNR